MAEQIGKYQIRGTLGAGAYGTVYLGWQEDLQRPVAIKELGSQLVADPVFLQGFREEARIMALLDHPNCVKVFDFIETGDRAFLVSEFVDGASLRQVVRDTGTLSPQQSLGVLKGSLQGLGHAHHLGLVHRDIKPENILADREGTSKLADFGQAYFGAGPGAAGAMTGSPPYMSPEQARGGICDSRSDLYSAGAILFEFLTGRPPFMADNPMAIMRAHVSDPVPDPRKLNKSLPKQATKLMSRALAKDPAARFQSADEMLAALDDTARAGYGKNWE
ncbi:MAG TPA: serine/threonine-protein kinase, partial [Candidatus Dormibacteraeota bacterium]